MQHCVVEVYVDVDVVVVASCVLRTAFLRPLRARRCACCCVRRAARYCCYLKDNITFVVPEWIRSRVFQPFLHTCSVGTGAAVVLVYHMTSPHSLCDLASAVAQTNQQLVREQYCDIR